MAGPLLDVFRSALRTQGLNEGSDWRFVYMDPGHPVYHCVYDVSTPEMTDIGLIVGDRLVALLRCSGANSLMFALTRGRPGTHLYPGP